MKTTMIQINGTKLKKLFEYKGIEPRKASFELGYDGGYFSQVFGRGKMPKTMPFYLENRYGIKYEDYEKKDDEEITVVGADISECLNGIEAVNENVGEGFMQVLKEMEKVQVKLENLPRIRIHENSLINISPADLTTLIYKAVYSAVLHAWENDDK